MNTTYQEFYVALERDEDGYYVGQVPQLKACYSQGETIDYVSSYVMLKLRQKSRSTCFEENALKPFYRSTDLRN
jgi:hypothetical protein